MRYLWSSALAMLLLVQVALYQRLVKLADVKIDGKSQTVWIFASVDKSRILIPIWGRSGSPAEYEIWWLVEGKRSLLGTVKGIYTGEWKESDDPQKLVEEVLNGL